MSHHPHHLDPAQRRSYRVIQVMRVFWVSCLLLGMALLPISMSAQDGPTQIVVGQIDGTITPVMARYVDRVIREAERDGAAAVVFEMDTPGGLSSAMDDIIRDIIESDVPVLVYVAPRGARAASAGVYISYAAHVAAMAPGTNIGSASPVFMGSDGSTTDGEDTMTKKVTNDAVAQIVNLANLRGRNAEWAEEAVREAVNITADQALELNVIDLMAPDLETLLTEIDGVQVETAVGPVTLETAGATTRQVEMTVIEEFMQLIADPTIAYLLLSLGMLGIFLELSNPGAMLPGIVGGLGVLLGLFALGTVPVNWAGVLLMVLAFGLFLADLFVPSGGLLTLGGLASFVIGSFLLVDPSAPPGYEISPTAIWTMTFAFVVFFGTIGYLVLRARRKKSVTGKEGMIGEIATVRQTLRPEGMVFVHGELWSAVLDPDAQGSVIRDGEHVVVSGLQGLRLAVRPIEQETGQQERSRLGGDPFLAAEGSRP